MRAGGAGEAPVLRAEGLVKSYRGRRVVDQVSLKVSPGEVVGLLGPNGAGKTTTFYMLVGLERADSGRIYLGDREISRWPIHRRALAGVGYLPQEPSVFRKLTVEENLLAVLEIRGIGPRERRERAASLLREFGLEEVRRQRGASLSGGERRRVEIARAVATDPAFLLLDEPFTGVDPIAVAELQGLIRRLVERGIGLLVTDHNVRETLAITDRAYILHRGKVLVHGTPAEIAGNEIARRFYLGEGFRL